LRVRFRGKQRGRDDPAVASDVANRLNEDEARREEEVVRLGSCNDKSQLSTIVAETGLCWVEALHETLTIDPGDLSAGHVYLGWRVQGASTSAAS
jgi:hypothetical protein